ncbi:ABC transporter ATP-binding protein [Martelella alba]|uniref:ABC transporter ATP-binding protein n=1 Tax=Martelella alba TaxID=2590451 RepID=A0A506UEB7_9HYPH|nr:ABC transporter ATP-binding protein [Martelella alba]TPW32320.1 ABC transporter ATP-binding protein [Martelella alba]
MSIFTVKDLTVSAGGATILHDVGFSVGHNELIGLIGPNGAGKSTLLKSMIGLMPHKGSVRLLGDEVSAMGYDTRARSVAYLPQEHEIAWPVTVRHVVALGRQPFESGHPFGDFESGRVISDAMARMGISHLAGRVATSLSGGEKARVLIARALAQTTPLLVADEPAAGLDPAHQIGLMKVFRDLTGESRSVITSMHDLNLAARWCTRLILLSEGRIVADGPPEDVLTAERLAEVYGVRARIEAGEDGLAVTILDLA